jgi:hypothetical protein
MLNFSGGCVLWPSWLAKQESQGRKGGFGGAGGRPLLGYSGMRRQPGLDLLFSFLFRLSLIGNCPLPCLRGNGGQPEAVEAKVDPAYSCVRLKPSISACSM